MQIIGGKSEVLLSVVVLILTDVNIMSCYLSIWLTSNDFFLPGGNADRF